jgi:SAM-dependent methyltransferase
MAAEAPAHLEPSELGTKEYWDSLYTTELTNHAANPSDIGTCWFDDSDAEAKVLSLLADLAGADSPAPGPPLDQPSASFLDLGCGNGSLLLALRDDGWAGPMLGVDYSAQSVSLARRVAAQREDDADDDFVPVGFREWDVVAGDMADALGTDGRAWDVVLDKGTFDAISLSDETDAQGRRLSEAYRDRVWRLVRPGGGLFIITSCNWTEPELRLWFDGVGAKDGKGGLVEAARVQYRTFSFGGVKGQTISTLCFRRS